MELNGKSGPVCLEAVQAPHTDPASVPTLTDVGLMVKVCHLLIFH